MSDAVSDVARTDQEQACDWLVLLNEGSGDPAEQARFEDWLDARPEHAIAWVAATETFEAMGAIGPDMEEAWRGVTPRRRLLPWKRGVQPRWRAPLLGGAMAASLALWLVPAALLRLQSDSVTQAGEVRAMRLADGSTVQMGPDSAIAVDYHQGERIVRLLKGSAWFDVQHNPAAPFSVVAGDVRTTVLGTSFDMRRTGGATVVSLKRGRVRVVDQTRSGFRDLAPGHWLRVGADHRVEGGVDDPALFGAWQAGALVAHDRPIAEVIDELRPWYRGSIVVLNREIGRRRVDGVYNARDPQSALTAVVAGAGGHVRQIVPGLLIVS